MCTPTLSNQNAIPVTIKYKSVIYFKITLSLIQYVSKLLKLSYSRYKDIIISSFSMIKAAYHPCKTKFSLCSSNLMARLQNILLNNLYNSSQTLITIMQNKYIILIPTIKLYSHGRVWEGSWGCFTTILMSLTKKNNSII